MLGTIKELWRYPVKSMQGELVEHNYVTWSGLIGDRTYAVSRREDGVIITAKMPEGRALLQAKASWEDKKWGYECIVGLPGYGEAPAPQAAYAIAELLGKPVGVIDLHQHPWKSWETNYRPPFSLRPGVGVDSSPLHIITTAAFETMQRFEPEGAFDALYFRPNMLVRTPEIEGFPEDEWIGKVLKIGGELLVYIRKPAERCPLPTQPQAGLPQNPKVLPALRRHHHDEKGLPLLGVYASIVQPGNVRPGDEISFA